MPKKTILPRRDAALDPLLLAAAQASGPHVTRNHYHHDFFPGVTIPTSEGSWDWTNFTGSTSNGTTPIAGSDRKRYQYVSKQAPRRERMLRGEIPFDPALVSPPPAVHTTPPVVAPSSSTRPLRTLPTSSPSSVPLVVRCMARTRVPTPYGEVFLHLYHNNKDEKEHLAVVVDPAQLLPPLSSLTPNDPLYQQVKAREDLGLQDIRSRTLDEPWTDDETEMDRLVRGAYVGRLSASSRPSSQPSHPSPATSLSTSPSSSPSSSVSASPNPGHIAVSIPPPIMRIHSECYTGETIGSMRCDCGEQLEEALRLIFEPVTVQMSNSKTSPSLVLPPRGVLLYLRQEGRSIGLLSKLRAYNLQDMGYDTLEANEMLGFQGDERGYGVVGAVLRDLGLAPELSTPPSQTQLPAPAPSKTGVRLLTNNPLKVAALEKEGIKVVERVEMVPRSWTSRTSAVAPAPAVTSSQVSQTTPASSLGLGSKLGLPIHTSPQRRIPAPPPLSHTNSFIGGTNAFHAPYGPDLDKYLKTKVEKMGHVLPRLWDDSSSRARLDPRHPSHDDSDHGEFEEGGLRIIR